MKSTVATLWVFALALSGIAGHVKSVTGWTALGVLALVPPIVVFYRLREPAQSLSQSIQEALR